MLLIWTSTCFRKTFALFGHPSWGVAFRVWGASMPYDFTVICSSFLSDFSRFRRWRANEGFSPFLGLGAKDACKELKNAAWICGTNTLCLARGKVLYNHSCLRLHSFFAIGHLFCHTKIVARSFWACEKSPFASSHVFISARPHISAWNSSAHAMFSMEKGIPHFWLAQKYLPHFVCHAKSDARSVWVCK